LGARFLQILLLIDSHQPEQQNGDLS